MVLDSAGSIPSVCLPWFGRHGSPPEPQPAPGRAQGGPSGLRRLPPESGMHLRLPTALAVPPPVLQVRDLHFAYSGSPVLIRNWSHSVPAGVTWLRGDTGSGKTSLLAVLAGTQPLTGSLSLAGIDLATDAAGYRRSVFWRNPTDAAFDALTPPQVIAALEADYPLFDAAACQRLMQAFALAPHLAKPLYALSTGTRRKVWLAAALSAGAALTLLDEPTAGLDAPSTLALMQALAALIHPPGHQSGHFFGRAVLVASGIPLDGVPLAGVIDLPLS